jgi:hypothetical protein
MLDFSLEQINDELRILVTGTAPVNSLESISLALGDTDNAGCCIRKHSQGQRNT